MNLVSVYRLDDARGTALRGSSLIDAIAEPPRSCTARIYDTDGELAHGRILHRWTLTPRGEGRVRAEAEGWLPTFLGAGDELAPSAWRDAS